MSNIIILTAVMSIFLLAGCAEQSHDYAFLMTHPLVLEKDAKRCAADAELNRTPACDEINRAAHDFYILVSSRRENPELFDKDILATESKLVTAEQALTQAQSGADRSKLAGLQQDIDDLREKVKVLLAVVAVTSAE